MNTGSFWSATAAYVFPVLTVTTGEFFMRLTIRREERSISSNLSGTVFMDKLQVISQITFDGELMIFIINWDNQTN